MKLVLNKISLSLPLILMGLVFYSNFLFAEENSHSLQAETHSALTEINKKMEKGNFAEAKTELQQLLKSDKLKDYDKAVIYQMIGFVDNSLGNFDEAAKNFQQALSYNSLPKEVAHELYYTTAQLLIHVEKPDEGLKYLAKWFAEEPQPKADAHILAASAYYQTKDYKQLIVHVEKALASSKKPPLNWYELLLAAYYETKEYDNAATILEKIIAQYPDKKDYWLQLASVYQQLKQEKKALAVYELAYTKGLLKEEDIVQLVKTYLYLQMPYKAGQVLEEELAIGGVKDNREMLDLLVDSWLLAEEREKAEPVLREIVKRFNDDKARLRLGQLYIELEQWDNVIELLNVKLQSKDKVIRSRMDLLVGIAEYYKSNFSKATQAFTQALSDKSTEEQAKFWLDHLKKKTAASKQES